MTPNVLNWSSQLKVSANARNRRLPGDKITLPQSALEALLAAAPVVDLETRRSGPLTSGFNPFNPFNQYSYAAEAQARDALKDHQQQLPHPLTFRLVNPENGRTVNAGIREFSAEEGEVGLSSFLIEALGLETNKGSEDLKRSDTADGGPAMVDSSSRSSSITVHAKSFPKGTYVKLRPLEAGYDPADWRSLLERYLRDNFTTLTNGEILSVPVTKNEHFQFLVDKYEPEGDGICIVDTDLEVDIEALNEEQARETLNKRLAKAKKYPESSTTNSSTGGLIDVSRETRGQIMRGGYVDYELKQWDRLSALTVSLEVGNEEDLSLLISPFSARQRSRPRLDEFVFADLGARPTKRIKITPTNVEIENAESIYIAVHAAQFDDQVNPAEPIPFVLSVSSSSQDDIDDLSVNVPPAAPGPDEVRCKNCQQNIVKRTLPLHEAFCYRNNVACPQCRQVFLKNSQAWKTHWHCPQDDDHGNGEASKSRHDSIFHPATPLRCPACDFEAFNFPILAQHRTSTCPAKEILCQFCHLVVPQQGPDDPAFTDAEVLLSGLTPHELVDGGRTTECHLCSQIVRLRDMRTHLLFHDRERLSRPTPLLCVNGLCGRTIKAGSEAKVQREQQGLCFDCFGPLHHTAYDPEGKALRRRIERRLLQQLMGGCGKSWCHNTDWCRTGRKNSTGEDRVLTVKDALPQVKPILDQLTRGVSSSLRFCVDESAQTRRATAEMMASEGAYELEWCVKALEEAKNNLEQAVTWLKDRAPRIGETVGQ